MKINSEVVQIKESNKGFIIFTYNKATFKADYKKEIEPGTYLLTAQINDLGNVDIKRIESVDKIDNRYTKLFNRKNIIVLLIILIIVFLLNNN